VELEDKALLALVAAGLAVPQGLVATDQAPAHPLIQRRALIQLVTECPAAAAAVPKIMMGRAVAAAELAHRVAPQNPVTLHKGVFLELMVLWVARHGRLVVRTLRWGEHWVAAAAVVVAAQAVLAVLAVSSSNTCTKVLEKKYVCKS
jgi:hypothetical protein